MPSFRFKKRASTAPSGEMTATASAATRLQTIAIPAPPTVQMTADTEAAEQLTDAILTTTPPASPTTTLPQRTGYSSASSTIRSTIIFVGKVLSSVPVVSELGLRMACESLILILEKYEKMNLNQELSADLEKVVHHFLYLVARYAAKNPSEESVKEFITELKGVASSLFAGGKAPEYLNTDEIRDSIDKLKSRLNSAIQLFQTVLLMKIVDRLDQLDSADVSKWKAEVEKKVEVEKVEVEKAKVDIPAGAVVKSFENQTFNVGGKLKSTTEAKTLATMTMEGTTVHAKQYNSLTTGSSVNEKYKGGILETEEDMEITTRAV